MWHTNTRYNTKVTRRRTPKVGPLPWARAQNHLLLVLSSPSLYIHTSFQLSSIWAVWYFLFQTSHSDDVILITANLQVGFDFQNKSHKQSSIDVLLNFQKVGVEPAEQELCEPDLDSGGFTSVKWIQVAMEIKEETESGTPPLWRYSYKYWHWDNKGSFWIWERWDKNSISIKLADQRNQFVTSGKSGLPVSF